MAIKTVDASNLSQFVNDRTAKGAELSTPAQVTEKAQAIAEARSPVVAATEETVSTSPDPGSQEPTAKAADKAKAGTDPAVQKRIDQLTAARREAEEFAESEYNARIELERRLRELEKKDAPAEQKQEELKRPSPKDFQTQEAYDAAMDEYDRKRDERTAQVAERRALERAAMERQNEVLRQRIETAKQSLPDFVEVIESADRRAPEVPNHIKAAILESELGPHIAYHLAKNPDDQKRIFAMTPAKALLELGKIEEKYAVTDKVEAKPIVETTRAPAPVAPIRSSDGVVATSSREAPNFQDYKRLRYQEMRKRR